MRKVLVAVVAFALGVALTLWVVRAGPVEGQSTAPQSGYAAVPNAIGSQDLTHKLLKYDQDGHPLYAWGTLGSFPGALWGVHGMSVDQEGNLYVAEVDNGRVQKFRPRAGANPNYLMARPVVPVWQSGT